MNTPNANRRHFLKTVSAAGAGLAASTLAAPAVRPQDTGRAPRARGKSVAGLTLPAMETVRVGFIGVGSRGSGHVSRMTKLDGVEVKAICDIHEPAAKGSQKRVVDAGQPKPDLYTRGDHDYRRMLERDDLDIVVISTPWAWHTPQCVDAMRAGKHAFVEVPAAVTLEECWELVDVAEQTQKNCMMLENVCYGREELLVLNMCRLGLFGELTHGEGAYIHNLRGQMKSYPRGTGSWRTYHHAKRDGNIYPTHGLGPIAQYMNINRGDVFSYMTSMSSPALGRNEYARENLPKDHPFAKLQYICGDMNTSLIKSAKGRSIMVQHDTTTYRAYDRINLIQGTKGTFRGYPGRICIGGHGWEEGDKLDAYYKKHEHPLWTLMGEESKKNGGHGGMDFLMFWRLIYCLRNGEALDQDVYDAASWSAVGPLSEISVANRSTSVDFPDFTRGKWETTEPLGIVS